MGYYSVGGLETIDVLKAKLTSEEFMGFLKGNILKYLCRANYKGYALSDYKKAAYYLARLTAETQIVDGVLSNESALCSDDEV